MQIFVFKGAPDVFHCGNERTFRKVKRGLGFVFARGDFVHLSRFPLFEFGKRLIVFGGFCLTRVFGLLSLHRFFGLFVKKLPALVDNDFAFGSKSFAADRKDDFGGVIGVHRIKLRDVALGD